MKVRVLTIACSLLLGGALAWYGTTEIFTNGVEADTGGAAGTVQLLPLLSAIAGVGLVVLGLCAAAWQIGRILLWRDARRGLRDEP